MFAVEAATVEEHPGIKREIVRGGEKPGVPGHSAHAARGGIVHHAADEGSVGLAGGRGDQGMQSGFGKIHRPGHSERPVDFLRGELVESLAADPPDHLAQQDEVDVAVTKERPGRRIGFLHEREGDSLVVIVGPARDPDAGTQPGGVRHQVADGDGRLFFGFELGQILRGGRIELEEAAFTQQHDRGSGRHDLGEGGGIKNRVAAHRFDRFQGAVAVDLFVDRAAVLDPEDASRQLMLCDGGMDRLVHLFELPGMEGGSRLQGKGKEQAGENGQHDARGGGCTVHGKGRFKRESAPVATPRGGTAPAKTRSTRRNQTAAPFGRVISFAKSSRISTGSSATGAH